MGLFSSFASFAQSVSRALEAQARVNEHLVDLYEKATRSRLFDANGNECGLKLGATIDAPEGVFSKIGRHMSIYPIGWDGERYGNSTYEEYNAPTEIEHCNNGVTIVFFGFKDKIKTASEDAFYTMDWGKVHYLALKSDMTQKEFEGNINRYNMHPDEGVQH